MSTSPDQTPEQTPEHPEPAEPSGGPLPPAAEPHDVGGTELALSIARALARSPRAAARRTGPRRPGRPGQLSGSWTRRGDGAATSGAHPDDRDPQTAAASLGRLVAEQGWSTELRVHGVLERWAAVVGDDIAAHASPESYEDGRLVVRTDSTAWATQLRLLAGSVVARLNEELGHGTVSFLEVQGPRAPSWRRGNRRVQGRGPRDTYG